MLLDKCKSEVKAKISQLSISLYLNLAACYLKLKDFKNGLASCNEALVLNPNHLKALFVFCKFCLSFC